MSIFKTYTLTVTRKTPGSYIDGRWIGGSDSTFEIETTWQPANGRDLEILEEGKRQSVVFKIFPEIELYTADSKTKRESDIVTGIDGYDYEVVMVAPYQNSLISHYKVLVMRIKENNT